MDIVNKINKFDTVLFGENFIATFFLYIYSICKIILIDFPFKKQFKSLCENAFFNLLDLISIRLYLLQYALNKQSCISG